MTPPSNGGYSHGTPDDGRKTYDSQQMIGSLGGTLAGINLGGGYEQSYPESNQNGGGVNWGSSPLPSNFNGNNSNTSKQHPISNVQPVGSRQNLLFGTDMKDLHEPNSPRGKGSFEMFINQGHSNTLGQEVLQFQHLQENTNGKSNQGRSGWEESSIHHTGKNIASPSLNAQEQQQDARKGTSPSNTTSSRSGSPPNFNKGDDRNHHNTQPFQGHGPNTMQMHNNGSQLNQIPQYTPQQQPSAPQVLYMAVPTPDGRGQMLQPVQMLQLPGGAQTFVLPTTSHVPPPDSASPGVQPMMVLPTAQQHQAAAPLDPNKVTQWSGPAQYSRSTDQLNNDYSIDRGPSDEYGKSMARNGNSPSERISPNGSTNGSDAIASLYSAPQRPPLDALLGHVRRLSRDQVGCRLLQQALDEEGPMAATLILTEGISFWGEAMVDPFGNYLFQKILEKITAEERIMLVKSVSARLVNASLNLHGTRSVQKVVELCAQDESQSPDTKATSDGTAADILTSSLRPAAARLCIDSHGNHVIQRILLKLSRNHSKFVFEAVAASVGDVARHRHGCCVIQRCLDSPPGEARSNLVYRIVEKSLELMQDAYGNYVVQYVLDVCSDEDVQAVCESVAGKVCLLAIQKFSSNVMEKCLERCTDRVKEMYLHELSDSDRIRELMMDPFGNYVVQRALSVATHSQAIRLVEAMRPHLISSQPGSPHGQRSGGMRNTAGGRRIMAKICRRFPNFSLTAMGPPEELYSQQKGQQQRRNQQENTTYQAMSPQRQAPPPPSYVSPHQKGQHVTQGNMRQPYYDIAGYYDHPVSGHANYHPHM
eukprot:CAMPEP_0194213850 /NCGR_PEP_ID=MMETSP0156-20130528/14706_1 /TAXON_ID=33649 /ORGANISM="Thalassionema nitzschioides, Strain L26-B" /LENGTH=817 /DNA_ID=CAMNT_0038941979 /DNA_START=237 /DNA_END=2690 /DNA_ORIENTATION=-